MPSITTEPIVSRTPLYANGSRTPVPYFITVKFMPQMTDMSTSSGFGDEDIAAFGGWHP